MIDTMGDLTTFTRLSQTLTILSSMIAPVVLILACGSLITITSQRLGRVIDRCRFLIDQLKQLIKDQEVPTDQINEEAELLFFLMDKATTRTRLLQRALISLYMALGTFIATSISLGVLDVINSRRTWLPVLLSLIGSLLLLYASLLLVRESRMARQAINREMDDALRYFKTNLEGITGRKKKRWWRRSAPAVMPPPVPPVE